LDLVQRENFGLGKVQRNIGFAPENELSNILSQQSAWSFINSIDHLNTTCDFNVHQKYVTSAPSETNSVEIDLLMDIPVNQVIKYTPSFLEKATQAWTQFLAIGVVSYFVIIYLFLGTAFESSILHT
jgi:hypothetical protein